MGSRFTDRGLLWSGVVSLFNGRPPFLKSLGSNRDRCRSIHPGAWRRLNGSRQKHMPTDERLSNPPLLTAHRNETTGSPAVCFLPPSKRGAAVYRSRIKSRSVNLQHSGGLAFRMCLLRRGSMEKKPLRCHNYPRETLFRLRIRSQLPI